MFEEESDMGGLPPPGNGNCENCDSRLWRADHGTFSSQSGRATRNLEAACAFRMRDKATAFYEPFAVMRSNALRRATSHRIRP
ncbi:hypothetical protein PC129_g2155 [Phytophthora cactorum]|uniref:Uncharacterized protein n=1 Tax=Phytophthora cactorum TaxID=29920 RepID=A0A8T1ECG8_9STRA|nr:hypothetical protein Pcac1_g7865 [Phytophthora cactorum]KAG2841095.1 hypothetical protein PC112_g3523 [Phytophthora cactorum]KAG2865409.1 hypothetical protein PC113_g3762 [Phytophthora cactorum]KAG2916537.1 hypothetical protein PC115_g11008 [Phytophthora cactorum]KAG2926110.1 hypothetical protein PC114_g3916 [Phytophthora cactorum]